MARPALAHSVDSSVFASASGAVVVGEASADADSSTAGSVLLASFVSVAVDTSGEAPSLEASGVASV